MNPKHHTPARPRPDRRTQNRVITLFTDPFLPGCSGCDYLVDWLE